MIRVKFLTGGNVMKLSFQYSVHLTDGVEDATGKLFLVVNTNPSAENLANFRLEHLGDLLL